MREDQLQKLLNEGDKQKCLDFFRGNSEKQRRAVAPMCQEWFRKINRNAFIETEPGTFSSNPLWSAAATAVFATASFSELKKLGWQARPSGKRVQEIMLDRRPPWLAEWVVQLLEEDHFWNHWQMIRIFMAQGLIEKPEHPHYVRAMISGIVGAGGWHRSEKTVEQALREDPSLLEDEVWQLFETEGEGENSLANWDRFTRGGKWNDALVALAQSGDLSRERLLGCALDALDLDFNHYRAKWFATFHDALQPDAAEQREFAERYLRLLGVSAPNIVSWSFKKVEAISKSGTLEAAPLIAALEPVLRARQKGIVKKALKLLGKTAKQSPETAVAAADMALTAMAHEEADVQAAALDVVEQYGNVEDQEFGQRLAHFADIIAPSERKRLGQLLNPAGQSGNALSAEADDLPSFDRTQLEGLDPALLNLFGVNELLENLEHDRLAIPAATFDGTDLPRLSSEARVAPIEDLDELIEVCARVIEDDSLVDDIERVLDGVARLCDQKPDDFAQRTGPLLKRAINGLTKNMAPFIGIGADDDLCGLIYAWCTGIVLAGKQVDRGRHAACEFEIEGETYGYFTANLKKPIGFLSRRVLNISQDAAAGRARQLLSAPTHTRGWIDPLELVQRVNARGEDGVDEADACLAMLRMAPDGRADALRQLQDVPIEWQRAVRYAMGADDIQIGSSPALWIAAARCRTPWLDDAKVQAAFPDHGPDAGRAACYQIECPSSGRRHNLTITSEPPPPETVELNCVTMIFHAQHGVGEGLTFELGGFGGKTAGSIMWTATIWPQARESFFARAACEIADNIDWWEARWRNKTLLEPQLDSRTPLGEMGLLLLAFGLAAKDPGEYGLATDIAIRAIEDGRLGADNFGNALARLLPTGVIKPARWQKRLADVARISPVHGAVIQQSLQRCLQGETDTMPRDFAKLLDLLKELSIDLDQNVACESCRKFLADIKGTGKAAKTAKALLAMELGTSSNGRMLARQVLMQRLMAVRQVASPAAT